MRESSGPGVERSVNLFGQSERSKNTVANIHELQQATHETLAHLKEHNHSVSQELMPWILEKSQEASEEERQEAGIVEECLDEALRELQLATPKINIKDKLRVLKDPSEGADQGMHENATSMLIVPSAIPSSYKESRFGAAEAAKIAKLNQLRFLGHEMAHAKSRGSFFVSDTNLQIVSGLFKSVKSETGKGSATYFGALNEIVTCAVEKRVFDKTLKRFPDLADTYNKHQKVAQTLKKKGNLPLSTDDVLAISVVGDGFYAVTNGYVSERGEFALMAEEIAAEAQISVDEVYNVLIRAWSTGDLEEFKNLIRPLSPEDSHILFQLFADWNLPTKDKPNPAGLQLKEFFEIKRQRRTLQETVDRFSKVMGPDYAARKRVELEKALARSEKNLHKKMRVVAMAQRHPDREKALKAALQKELE